MTEPFPAAAATLRQDADWIDGHDYVEGSRMIRAIAEDLRAAADHIEALEARAAELRAQGSDRDEIVSAATLARAAQAAGQVPQALALLQTHYQQAPCLDVMEALVTREAASPETAAQARTRYIDHLNKPPSLIAASRWMAGETLTHEAFHPPVQAALDHAAKPLARYRCAACGFEAKEHFWHCPGCQAWDSYPPRRVEEL